MASHDERIANTNVCGVSELRAIIREYNVARYGCLIAVLRHDTAMTGTAAIQQELATSVVTRPEILVIS
jgi:hypothetical protein